MKKRTILSLITILVILIATSLSFMAVDLARIGNGNTPTFATNIKIIDYASSSSKVYSGLGYKIIVYTSSNDTIVKVGTFLLDEDSAYLEDCQEFTATILEATEHTYLVKPDESTKEIKSSDKITIANLDKNPLNVGTRIKITYVGAIQESYPAKINVTKIEVLN